MEKPFVDRIDELKQLKQALEYDGQENPVLVFTGIGGMGKTALRIAFEEQVLKPNQVPYAVLDYDGDPNLRSIEATLRAIRRQLGRYGVRTPVYDYLYARYFELSMGVRISSNNCPPELEGVVSILEGIPIVGNVTQIMVGLTQLGLKVKERLQHKEWLYRLRELEPREVLNLLPEVLAEDLEETITCQIPKILKSTGFRIPLFLDAYERLSESQIDDVLHRKLLLLTPHLLRVVFTRDPIPWEHDYPKEWQDKITRCPPLEVLSQQDAKVFLQEKNVTNSDLQDHLYQLTKGYPFHLELCADIFKKIEGATGRTPENHDFQELADAANLTEDLVNHLLRQLKENERDLMGLAAYPIWFTEEILEVLSSVPESVPRIFKKLIGLSMISAHPKIPYAYVIRKEVRDLLISQQRQERLWKERHGKLSNYHKERWEETQAYHHLTEAIYHLFYVNLDSAMVFFEEHFWKLLENCRFGDAEGLLETIPLDKLSDPAKRKADFARAQYLTSSLSSRESLETAKSLYKVLIASETDEELLAKYLCASGDLLEILGDYVKAYEYYQNSLAIYLKMFGEDDLTVARLYNSIGNIEWEKGELDKASDNYQKALSICSNVHGENHLDLARCYNNIGNIHENRSEYETASKYYHMALTIQQKVLGKDHPEVADSYSNLGIVFNNQGDYAKAMEYYKKALDVRLMIYGEDHPDIAGSYNNMAILCEMQGEYDQALDFHKKALEIRLHVFGEEHPKTAETYNNIGVILIDQEKLEQSIENHQKSLAIRLRVYEKDHIDIAFSYGNLGLVFFKQGEYTIALEYNQKALDIFMNSFGKEHPTVSAVFNNMGEIYHKQGKYKEALESFQRALVIRKKSYGENHPLVAETLGNMAETLWVQQKEEDAINHLLQTVEIYRKFELWEKVATGLTTLAAFMEDIGLKSDAEMARREVIQIKKEHILPAKRRLFDK